MKKRSILYLVVSIVFVASVVFGVTVLNNLKKNDEPEITKTEEKKDEKVYKTYDMYVSINPFVKLTFKAEYEKCEDGDICFTGNDEIVDYELINDDAKTIYNDLDIKGKNVLDILVELCDVARANKVAFDSVSFTTNWNDMYDDEVLKKEIKEKSKYEFNFDIFIDVKEYINDAEIKEENENKEITEYIVTFDRNNGDSVIKRKVKENEKVVEIKSGDKNGYTFVEWQLNGKKYDFNTPITENLTLVAKWKKGVATTTTTKVNNNESTKTTTKVTTTAPSYTSTIDKINLNENILVVESGSGIGGGSGCGGEYYHYVFVTNAASVLSDYGQAREFKAGNHSSVSNIHYDDYANDDDYYAAKMNACSIAVSDFESKVATLQYDTAKENAAISVLEKYKNSTTKGIGEVTYSVNNHAFSYFYTYLYMENANSFGEFGKQFNQLGNLSDVESAFKSITLISNYCYGGCGDYQEPEIKVLDESLCSKYNLTCDRW